MEQENLPDANTMTYEQAKQELAAIVSRLETGNVPLEQSLSLWKRGQDLAARCSAILNAATRQVEQAQEAGGTESDQVAEQQRGETL